MKVSLMFNGRRDWVPRDVASAKNIQLYLDHWRQQMIFEMNGQFIKEEKEKISWVRFLPIARFEVLYSSYLVCSINQIADNINIDLL